MSLLSAPRFHDDTAAREYLEGIVWANGVFCPHCGGTERIYAIGGGRPGLRKCGQCRKQFTVTVGTVFESSHVPLHKWMQAAYLLSSSKKGFSAHQLHRTLGVTYKTAWFMAHRLREAMQAGKLPPMGGAGKVVEADETFLGDLPAHKAPIRKNPDRPKFGPTFKRAIVSLVERGGQARSFYVGAAKAETVAKVVAENVDRASRLHTDQSAFYKRIGAEFAAHESVDHGRKEYARGDVTTNSIEGFFSVFKRGMKGIYQHCSEQHLHRYLAEFDFRFNNRIALGVNDTQRAHNALAGIVGKRLTYGGSTAR